MTWHDAAVWTEIWLARILVGGAVAAVAINWHREKYARRCRRCARKCSGSHCSRCLEIL